MLAVPTVLMNCVSHVVAVAVYAAWKGKGDSTALALASDLNASDHSDLDTSITAALTSVPLPSAPPQRAAIVRSHTAAVTMVHCSCRVCMLV